MLRNPFGDTNKKVGTRPLPSSKIPPRTRCQQGGRFYLCPGNRHRAFLV